MHPSIHAKTNPDKPAVILAETGETLTFKQLDEASNRVAQFFRSRGLKAEDVVGFMVENTPAYYALTWGAQRSGLRYVCLSTRLTADEADYILQNSGSRMLVMSASLAPLAAQLSTEIERYALGGEIAGYGSWEAAIAEMPATPIADERAGVDMLYSSGTTGRPKGVRVPLPEDPSIAQTNPLILLAMGLYRIGPDSVYLSPAPLYHAAPLRWSMTVQKIGGTVVMMKKFDPEGVLAAIEKYKITCGQYVPTHFIRRLNMREQLIREVEIVPLEVVVRNVAAGSLSQRLGIEEGTQLPRSIIEFYYKNDQLNDPMVSEEHITAFGWATPQEIDDIMALAIRVNDFLTGLFLGIGIRLVDFKMECGRLFENEMMRIIVADEISPDSCRLWDVKSNEKLDKDRFRRDLGGLLEAYTEVAKRLGILMENERPAGTGPVLVKG